MSRQTEKTGLTSERRHILQAEVGVDQFAAQGVCKLYGATDAELLTECNTHLRGSNVMSLLVADLADPPELLLRAQLSVVSVGNKSAISQRICIASLAA